MAFPNLGKIIVIALTLTDFLFNGLQVAKILGHKILKNF